MFEKLSKIHPKTFSMQNIREISAVFVCFLLFFESFVLEIKYSKFLISVYDNENLVYGLLLIFSIILSVYIFYRFIVFSLSTKWYYKPFAFLLFLLFNFVEYSYVKALGRFVEKYDLELAFLTTTDQQIASLMMYSSFVALLPSLLFLILLIFVKSKETFKNFREFAVLSSFFLTFFLLFQFLFQNTLHYKFPTIAYIAFGRTITNFVTNGPLANGKWASNLTNIKLVRRQIPKPDLPEDYTPNNNIIFVLDESVRGDHLSLNGYKRSTTPFLESLRDKNLLTNWGVVASASTGSLSSYNALITGLTPDDLPVVRKVNTYPTIFQYAKAMKYKTYFFDGQMERFWGGIEDDKNYLDHWITMKKIKKDKQILIWDYDKEIAKDVKKIISSSKGNFIFIFKRGSHIPYHKNFPSDKSVWKPNFVSNKKFAIPKGEDRLAAINAYDNSIKFNLDSFFQTLIDDYSSIPNNSIIVYTSDHGQTLFENEKASHGGNTKNEAKVPLFLIGKTDLKADTKYKASHQNLYPTLLDLMNYPYDLRERTNILSLFKAKEKDSKPRYFNPMTNPKKPFD